MITGEMFHIVKMSQWIPPLVQFQTSTNFQMYHYLPVAETPITNTDEGKTREVDDYHYRAGLKQVHKKNEINIEDSASVQTFAKDALLKKALVKKYLEHLNHLEMMSDKRKMEKKNNSGTLARQHVCVVDKYIHKHNLNC